MVSPIYSLLIAITLLDVTIVRNNPSVTQWENPLNYEEGGWGLVQRYNVYGDIFTNIQVSDLDLLGIKPNRR